MHLFSLILGHMTKALLKRGHIWRGLVLGFVWSRNPTLFIYHDGWHVTGNKGDQCENITCPDEREYNFVEHEVVVSGVPEPSVVATDKGELHIPAVPAVCSAELSVVAVGVLVLPRAWDGHEVTTSEESKHVVSQSNNYVRTFMCANLAHMCT